MFRSVTGVIAIFAVSAMLAGCSAAAPDSIQLTDKDAGRTFEVRSGGKVEVVLEGNPTTGYTWEVAPESSKLLKPVGDAQFKADTSALGSSGKLTLRFDATGAGTAALKLVYRRPWETNVAPAKTFEATVVVK